MSFLKFWGKKGKKEEADIKIDPNVDPELEKRRLRHSLSISRSGRFKQRKRERSQISDQPELFFGKEGSSVDGPDENQNPPARPAQSYPDSGSKVPPGNLRVGQSVAT
ncbi:unnamed protein product [Lymnaea stagnalis]|uniref:Uncharacterized protein n=1 Tax=Lymnaea stagnalis TaxID=6523 RepID=A0AAV2HIP4_LYMST